MKEQLDKLTVQLKPLIQKFIELRVFIFILAFLGIYGFLIIRVNSLVQGEPPATAVDDANKTVQRLKIDQDSVDKIQDLQSQNVQVQSLFEDARNNPFNE